jgi:putative membrane protein
MTKLVIRWLINFLALFAAAWLVPGISVDGGGGWTVFAVMALILGLVNAVLRPLLKLLTCPLILLTLGLFTLVINGFTLWLSSWMAVNWFEVGFYVDGLWAAFLGGLVVSIVSLILSAILMDKDEKRRRPTRDRR